MDVQPAVDVDRLAGDERQVAAVLVKRDASDEERAGALRRAAGFGTEVSTCRCLE